MPYVAFKQNTTVFARDAGFIEVGGYDALVYKYFRSWPNSTLNATIWNPELYENYSYTDCGIPNTNSFHLFRPATDSGLPWPGIIFGLTISSIWYWCSDQVRPSHDLHLEVTFTLKSPSP